MMIRKRSLLLSVLFAMLLGACSLETVQGIGSEEEDPAPDIQLQSSGEPAPRSELADMIERILPSVVNVRVESVSFDPLGEAQEGRGEGSGVVIDESGTILTNNHVVEGATEVEVVFPEGEKYEGRVIGTAPENDIAVIQIEADEDLLAIEIGDSSTLRLGDDVVAIGFPLGLGGSPTVTRGIVSSEDRTIDLQDGPVDQLRGLLQTDAAINPGNSGGALVDSAGRLVGINTAAAQAGSAENIGFAIPINTALPIAQEIIEDPPEERTYLGVNIRDLNPAIAAELGFDPDLEGALIVGLFPDGPAERAGLERGDVIVGIGGQQITGIDDVNLVLRDFDPGEIVDVEVVRGSGRETIEVELEQRPTTLG